MKSKFKQNKKRVSKLDELKKTTSLNNNTDELTKRCKFNFYYFNKHCAGQDFSEWEHSNLVKLLECLKEFSAYSLNYWKSQGCSTYTVYDFFPIEAKTDFKEPINVPVEARWARFKLNGKIRLIGFTVPESYDDKEHSKTKKRWDANTFYIVFLDQNHRFWHSESD